MRPWVLNRSVQIIENGGILAYPTEAVYGLGCNPFCPEAVWTILRLKMRSASKGLIVVGTDISQFRGLIDLGWLQRREDILATWPGPVTWVLPAKPGAPGWLTGTRRSIAVRVSAHPLVQQLCRSAGPLVSTSANPGGCSPARDAARVRAYFGDALDYILPGSVGEQVAPTEIRDAISGRMLRSSG